MVVTRRVPVPPPAPTSRSASTQNVPRVSRTKSHVSQQPADATSKSVQPLKETSPFPTASQNGGKARRPKVRAATSSQSIQRMTTSSQRSRFRIPSLSWLLLTIFSFYALSTLHPSPGQSFYNVVSIPYDMVIQPYLLPPLRTSLSHPSIEHHVTKVRTTFQPYTQRLDSTARPIVKKLSQFEQYRLRPLVRHGTRSTFNVVQKTWNGIIVQNYRIHLRPLIGPYLDRYSSFFHRTIGPPLRTLVIKSYLLYNDVKPRVTKGIIQFRHYSTVGYAKTSYGIKRFYSAIQPYAKAFWVRTQPHVRASYKFLKPQAIKGLSILRVYASLAATRLGDARREFVDPHLKRIWDKVENHSAAPSTVPLSSSYEMRLETSTASADFFTAASTTDAPPVTESSISPSPISIEVAVSTSLGEGPLEPVASVISDSTGLGVAAETLGNKEMDQAWIVAPSISVAIPSPEASTETSSKTAVPVSASAVPPIAGAEDVDDFLQELGISEDELPKDNQSVVSGHVTAQHTFSARQEDDASAAATLRVQVAAKRASIVKRHGDWQARMDELYEARERDLRKTLVSLRKNAVEELRSLTLRHGPGHEKVVDSIEQEAGRLVKGVEGYLKKELDRKEKLGREWHDQLEEKKNQWEKVLSKVDDKFTEKVKGAQEEVHGWYIGIRDKEGAEVLKTSSELKSLAETAQADLGLDYAWLEDVTYEDWQKYHDLMRTAEQFEETARAIQNGTHPHPPVDPLTPALETLERDVQGVIDGFRARFSMLRTEGNNLYTNGEPGSSGSSSSLSASSEPTMSILPITGDAQGNMMDASNIILSKSEDQIKQALGAAGYAVDETHDHVEL